MVTGERGLVGREIIPSKILRKMSLPRGYGKQIIIWQPQSAVCNVCIHCSMSFYRVDRGWACIVALQAPPGEYWSYWTSGVSGLFRNVQIGSQVFTKGISDLVPILF